MASFRINIPVIGSKGVKEDGEAVDDGGDEAPQKNGPEHVAEQEQLETEEKKAE